jgi:tetratricopeptide (TPR) repeat protein
MKHWIILAALAAICGVGAAAQSRTGKVNFANSGAATAQESFQGGLAQLHNFQYEQAEHLFRQAEASDPNFAMAYWGEALTHVHPLWNYEDLAGARAVLQKLAPTAEQRAGKAGTEREKEYLHSIEVLFGEGDRDTRNQHYADALALLHEHYPQDVDAAALYALSLLGKQLARDPATYMRAAAILEDYFPNNQQHPGVVHYLIHSYDDPVHAPLGMRAARLYGKIAPDSGHALHMTSHIFIAMGMWRDVIQANLESLASSTRQSKSGADLAASCNHGNSWLSYGYLQVGDFQRAHNVIASCMQKTFALPLDKSSYGYAQQMVAHYLVETQQWNDSLLGQPAPPEQFPHALATYWYSHAMAAAQRGDVAEARKDFDALTSAHAAMLASLAKEAHPNMAAVSYAAIEEQQVKAVLLFGHGDKAQALEVLQEAAKKERAIPFEFGPPAVPKPSAELVAELLMRLNRPLEAIQVLRDQLTRTPGKTATLSDLRDAAKLAKDSATQKSAEEVLATNLAKAGPAEQRKNK